MDIIMWRLLLLAAVALAPAAPARAESKHCTVIGSLPYYVTAPGNYCLQQGLAHSSGVAVGIYASNVTLDCNGHHIEHVGGPPSGTGIAGDDLHNVIVRNCHVQNFTYGIWLHGTGNLVEGNHITGSKIWGIYVVGDGTIVRRNRVLDTGGGTGGPMGIYAVYDIDLIDNTVAGVRAVPGSGVGASGIAVMYNDNGVVAGNLIRDVLPDDGRPAFGISIIQSQRLSIHGNRVANPGTAGMAIRCSQGIVDIASDNHASGFAQGGLHLCTDGGDNVVLPTP